MKEQFTQYKELPILDGRNIHNVIGLVSAWMFGLAGFCVWLITILIGKYLKE